MSYKRDVGSLKSNYIKGLYATEDNTLKAIQKSISDYGIRPINIGAEEGKLLQILLKLNNTKTVIEIGTLVGYSTTWIARALPINGKIYSFENDEKTAAVARVNLNSSDIKNKVELVLGDAHENLKRIESKGPFDAIFIDAEKSGYCKYLDWAEVNIRKGGMIIADNTFLFGMVFDDEAPKTQDQENIDIMKEFNQRLADSERYDSIIIPTNEGLSVAIKKF